jgi:PAS domain S-box-containing protein
MTSPQAPSSESPSIRTYFRTLFSSTPKALGLLGLLWCSTSLPMAAVPMRARFVHASVEQGLSQSTVQAIVQDHVGFLWYGTEEGLNRYDGYSFLVYKHDAKDPHSLSNDRISALFEDSKHRLWVGTNHGLCRFDRDTETFTTIGTIIDRVSHILETPDGTLWVGADGGGLYFLPPNRDAFFSYDPDPKEPLSLAGFTVSALHLDGKGRLWIGTRNAGLDLFVPGTPYGHFKHFRHAAADPNSLSHDEVWSLASDSAGNLWVATYGGGLNRFDPETGIFKHYRQQAGAAGALPSDMVTCVYSDRDGTLWVGTDGAGLLYYDSAADRFEAFTHDAADPLSLSQNVILTLYEDVQRQLWIGTFLGGADLLKRPRRAFNYFSHNTAEATSPSDPSVAAFLEDRQGNIWIGMERGWLDRFDRKTASFAHYRFPSTMPGGSAVLSLHEDRRGRIWVGSYRGGLARFDPDAGRFQVFLHDAKNRKSIGDDEIWTIAEDEQGALWLGTNAGLDRFDPETGEATAHFQSPSAGGSSYTGVRALLFDRDGNLWVGALGGLSLRRKGESAFIYYQHDDHDPASLSEDGVVSLRQDTQGRIWIGTLGGGLNRVEAAGKFTAYKNFPSNSIYGIEEAADGGLWLSTNQGLARFDPGSARVDRFDLTNGLQSLQFHLGASLKARDGKLFFGSIDGFYAFDPAAIKPDSFAPPVVLTSLRVFNDPAKRTAGAGGEIVLSHDDKIFSVEFAALDYTFPRRNRYAYIMEGFSPRWVEMGTKRDITFTSLDPGEYTFRVKASNSDGVWNKESTAALKVTVRPPIWGTWWFRGLSVGSVGLLVLTAHRLRVRRLTADIAERKRAEQALRQAEEKYRELVEDIDDIIFAADETGRITYISPVVESVFGYAPSEIVGHSFTKLVAPEDLAALLESLRKPGSSRPTPLEHRIVTKSGEIRWMRSSSRPILNGDRICGLRGVLTEISERKKLEEQLRQSQKMDAVGQLAGGVAHDFNNLLTGIISYSDLLLEDPDLNLSADVHSSLSEIRSAGQRAAALTRQLLAFSRRQMLQPQVLNLNTLVVDMEKMLQRLIGEDVQLAISLEPSLGRIKADPSQIEQIILNLAINARDAMPRGGKLTIETRTVTLDETYTREHVDVLAGNYVRLAVSDNGCGMLPDVQAHIFEPFFTTKGVGKGTGLGLSTIYGIVKQSAGHITVYSEVDVGTTFKIYLPCVDENHPPTASRAPFMTLPQGAGTVLLVEDNDVVRKIARQILQQYGYTVLEASHGDDALGICERHSGPIHLLLTDVIMPGINGRELAEQLRTRFPDIKVIFMSGYTDDAILRHGGLGANTILLEKPFTPEALMRKVHDLLSQRNAI